MEEERSQQHVKLPDENLEQSDRLVNRRWEWDWTGTKSRGPVFVKAFLGSAAEGILQTTAAMLQSTAFICP